MIPVVFIVGPFRANTPWDVEQNVRRAESLALGVANIGAMPLCPHTNTRFFDKQCTDEFWLDGTRELLRRCDALITVDGWEHSDGSRGEIRHATDTGMPIFHNLNELETWIRGKHNEGV